MAMLSNMEHSALRCICLAYKEVGVTAGAEEPQLTDSGLVCLAILGIKVHRHCPMSQVDRTPMT